MRFTPEQVIPPLAILFGALMITVLIYDEGRRDRDFKECAPICAPYLVDQKYKGLCLCDVRTIAREIK